MKIGVAEIWDFACRYSWGRHIVFRNNCIYSEFLRVSLELIGEYHDSS